MSVNKDLFTKIELKSSKSYIRVYTNHVYFSTDLSNLVNWNDADKLNVYRYEDNLVFMPEQDGDIAVSRKGCCIQLYSRKLVNFILDVSDGERKFNPVVEDNCVYINVDSHNK